MVKFINIQDNYGIVKKLLNRQIELEALTKTIKGKNSRIILMYGRRRVGKSHLLAYLHDINSNVNNIVYYACNHDGTENQLKNIIDLLVNYINEIQYLRSVSIQSWDQFWSLFLSLPIDLTLILDEFPYLLDQEPSLPSKLQNEWDRFLRSDDQVNKKIIICGSSISTMQELIESKRPLYGRIKESIEINPLKFDNAKLFLEDFSIIVQIQIYMIVGGIPFYLESIKEADLDEFTLDEVLVKVLFSKFSFFREEIPLELKMSTRGYSSYFSILLAITKGNKTFSEISNKSRINSKNLTYYLDVLMKAKLIEVEEFIFPHSRHRTFKISDSFTQFWFYYYHSNTNQLLFLSPKEFVQEIVLESLNTYLGPKFEEFCREWIIQISLKGKLSDKIVLLTSHIGKYFDLAEQKERPYEIDIVGGSVNKRIFILGECKWQNKMLKISDIKSFLLKTKHVESQLAEIHQYNEIKYYFFTKLGVNSSLKDSYSNISFVCINDFYS